MNRPVATSLCLLLAGTVVGCSNSAAGGNYAPITGPFSPPTQTPTTTPTTTPTVTPTTTPIGTPTTTPIGTPTTTPSAAPTTTPTATPAPTTPPTVTPSGVPTATPTPMPTVSPTASPTTSPTVAPTVSPTASPTVTPTVMPTMMPTAGPAGVLTVNPNPVQLLGTGAAYATNAIVSETSYTGTFGETDTCGGIATLSTSNNSGPSATYLVTGQAAGSCTATFTDSTKQSVVLTIKVTTNGFVITGRARHR